MEYAIYRLFDKAGTLLYIGRSKDPFKRFYQHMTSQPWLAEIDHHTEEGYFDFVTATAMERAVVRCEKPKYNKNLVPMLVCPKCGGTKPEGPSYCKKCKSEWQRQNRKKLDQKRRGITIS